MSSPPPQPIDLGFLPPSFRGDVQVFLANNQGINWQTWSKPRGISMCYMLAISGGGGGGGGFSRSAGNPGGGGGGGGCSGVSRLIVPAYVLPDVLYVQVGRGGAGGVAPGVAEDGTNSYISLGRSSASPNAIVLGGNNAPAKGGAGTAGGVGSGGSASTNPSVVFPVTALGIASPVAGLNGGAGGSQTGAAGTDITAVWNTIPLCGGAGGAGCTTTNFAGGAITLQATPDFTAQSVAGGTAAGTNVNGNAGLQYWQPLMMTGGSGGGSNNSGTAGNGGKGGIGCGGGGGGAGVTGGRGGDGGNGICLIISW